MSANEFDLVVVGAGFAGLVAANRAAQLGCRVCLLEKGAEDVYACNSRIATGVLSVAHGNPRRSPEALLQAIMEDTEGHANPDLAHVMANTVNRAMVWLDREGVKIIKIAMGGRPRWILAPPVPLIPGEHWHGRGPDQALKRLTGNLRARGGVISYDTQAVRLLTRSGRCRGVSVVSRNGTAEITATSTILADGGFQGSSELLARFISPAPEGLQQRNAGSGCGDALRMAETLGAELIGTDGFYGHLMAQDALEQRNLWPYPTIDSLASAGIVVNSDGRRFMDEGIGGIPMANRLAKLTNPLGAVAVFDDQQWQQAGAAELVAPNPYLEQLGGNIFSASSIAYLAERLEIPSDTLSATVCEYNATITAGRPERLVPGRSPGRFFG